MLNLNSIMIGTHQPKVLGEFYEKIFGKPDDEMTGNDWYGWKVSGCFFTVGPHSEVSGKSKEPQRIIINLEAKDVRQEFERIKKTGAEVIKEPYEMEGWEGSWIATFADPDGNYFQLMSPWK